MSRKLHPIHSSQEHRLNPEYKAYYNEHAIAVPKLHTIPIDVIRSIPRRPFPGCGPDVPVGKTEDIKITPDSGPAKGVTIPTRCYTPPGSAPDGGWPVLVFYHGGGWTVGGLESETDIITNICTSAKCVVVSVDYRLAPEHPFPAAVDDAWAALLWVAAEGKSALNINPDNIGVGGSSAGGNLAAVMAQRAASSSHGSTPRVAAQLLNIPVTDNTRTPASCACWRDLQHSPALSADMMLWFRAGYLPRAGDAENPEASPLLWRGDWAALPPAVVVVAGLDVLRDEGEAFGERLRRAGVRARVVTFPDQPHIFPAMSGVLEDGRRAITVMCEGLREVFYQGSSVDTRSNI
ncbi:Alpha/beta hydrolase fold-3 [Cordyceps fumosorosea ARSEF 2679]|uniref:Alpha/beta hydrolase fold-3 n=1 Tax=Cordyceps fumosorosea (strain ARSEF 2679) TaxID=1081104 RepID=A0A162MUJ1_CORFA|nr:Alpha/beta hydrolase fold-3 [Cordyceps fumosorosea ARSEF 2679]OAA70699.1 Alpha/beta hydrolase fold-3 [Cordyceps fumosorosea ARSEF 2679]